MPVRQQVHEIIGEAYTLLDEWDDLNPRIRGDAELGENIEQVQAWLKLCVERLEEVKRKGYGPPSP